jgi:uncharacterized protein (TIRG00374 family)
MRISKRFVWKAAGVGMSAALMLVAFWKVDARQLFSLMLGAKLWVIAAVIIINFGVVLLKAWRWRELLASAQRVQLRIVFLATLIGFMANSVLPARAGEFVRVLVLGKKCKLSKATVLGSLALDHIFEGAAMVLILLALPFLVQTPDWLRTGTMVVAAVVTGMLLLLSFVLRAQGDYRLLNWVLPERLQARAQAAVARLRHGLVALRSPMRIANVLALALASWLVQALMLAICLHATDLHLSFREALFVLMVINMAIVIPSAPGSLGAFEFSAVVALGFLGVDKTPALSFALIFHLVQLVPVTLAGVLALPVVGVEWRTHLRNSKSA